MLNTIKEIVPASGDFVVLEDYGTEGLKVAGQATTVASAINLALASNCAGVAILKLVHFTVKEKAKSTNAANP